MERGELYPFVSASAFIFCLLSVICRGTYTGSFLVSQRTNTHIWDPERNTNEFVAAMGDWSSHGLMGETDYREGYQSVPVDWAIMCGPVFAETPFNYAFKGLEMYNYGTWLKEALVFPDRIRLTVDAIRKGTGAMFLGGWLSFTGEMGKGGWNRTGLNDVLPVQCLDYEDLVESTEGFTPKVGAKSKKKLEGIKLDTFPPILGYNKTIARKGSDVLLTVKQTGDPLLVHGKFGKGKVLAYMSDPAPH
jgi:hypothetical protein